MSGSNGNLYRVRWEIDIEAGSEWEAAEKARAIQLDPTNIATVFNVTLHGEPGFLPDHKTIDLNPDAALN